MDGLPYTEQKGSHQELKDFYKITVALVSRLRDAGRCHLTQRPTDGEKEYFFYEIFFFLTQNFDIEDFDPINGVALSSCMLQRSRRFYLPMCQVHITFNGRRHKDEIRKTLDF